MKTFAVKAADFRASRTPKCPNRRRSVSDDIVIIVGSALLVSAGVARSRHHGSRASALCARILLACAPSSRCWSSPSRCCRAFVKNIGALAIMIPIAFQFARRSNISPSAFLMPMAFASLLGGLMTQIGTSPNIVVSRLREEIIGESFGMFDFTPVGLSLTGLGIVFLVLFLLDRPAASRQDVSVHHALDIKNYVAEAKVTEGSSSPARRLPIS